MYIGDWRGGAQWNYATGPCIHCIYLEFWLIVFVHCTVIYLHFLVNLSLETNDHNPFRVNAALAGAVGNWLRVRRLIP